MMRMRKLYAKLCRLTKRLLAHDPLLAAYPQAPAVVMENKLLYGKNVLITGAGRNIGLSIALEMARQGANVYFTDNDTERVKVVSSELNAYPVKSCGYVSDISNSSHIDDLLSKLMEQHIRIDVLVNNVGGHFGKNSLTTIDINEVRRSFEVNLFGPLYLTKKITQQMIQQNINGSVIFITSIHQWEVFGQLAYSTCKAALGMLIKELAVDLAPHGIRVNGIAPGWTKEDKMERPLPNPWVILHGSSIKPCYIGRTAVYLASDYFSWYTTGTVLKIDAGLSLGNHMIYSHLPYSDKIAC